MSLRARSKTIGMDAAPAQPDAVVILAKKNPAAPDSPTFAEIARTPPHQSADRIGGCGTSLDCRAVLGIAAARRSA
jgi:hypothetical protein